MRTQEAVGRTVNGWAALVVLIVISVALGIGEYHAIKTLSVQKTGLNALWVLLASLACLICLVCWGGFFTLQPNQAAVLVLFGKYTGTERTVGFRWANPLLDKTKMSLRARNLNMESIKVNDKRGNPVEIAAVVVWRVQDTAQAVFDVDKYEHYVTVQSEAALRHLASAYPYDTTEEGELSLRGSTDDVSRGLQSELQDRLSKAGVMVDEARLSHLAYAPEIAGAMLQRQQAEAIVAARTRIVDGAVGIVEMALDKLERSQKVTLDEERKAAMVNNLLVVLCGDRSAHPVINTGSLYS